MLTSHSRCHGTPPTEPWEYGEEFIDDFRRTVELRYRLMPYVYAQAAHACREEHPMLRTLFFEYPEDRTSWLVEDEYLFGTDILVAPLMEEARSRDVYLPPGLWSDYQGGVTYQGARWHHVHAGEVPIVMLVRRARRFLTPGSRRVLNVSSGTRSNSGSSAPESQPRAASATLKTAGCTSCASCAGATASTLGKILSAGG